MITHAARRVVPWVVVPIAVGGLLLGGLPLVAVLLGALLIAAMLGRVVSRTRRPGGLPADRAVVAGALASWALVVIVVLASIAAGHVTHGATDLGLPASPLFGAHSHALRTWDVLLDLLVAIAAVSSGFAIRALSAPRRPPAPLGAAPGTAAIQAARAIVAEHGVDSLSPFVLRPDKSLVFADGGLVAYRVVGDTAVVSADPVGPDGAAHAALGELLHRAREARLHVALYGASDRYLDTYRELGLRALCVGEEAVVDPARFTLEGRPVRKLRQSVHRIERRGWRVAAYRGRDVDGALEAELDGVERVWRSGHERMLGFAMSLGEYEPGVHSDDLYLLAWSPEGDLRAVMRFIDHRGNLSLDTMRRVGETPNGLNETLICHALAYAREAGVAEVSLNYAGFAHLIRQAPSGGRLRRSATRAFLRVLSGRFQMDRLVLFNDKFSPQWRPRYLVYESRMGLPRAALRVLQAEGYLSEPRRRSSRSLRRVQRDASQPAVQRFGR